MRNGDNIRTPLLVWYFPWIKERSEGWWEYQLSPVASSAWARSSGLTSQRVLRANLRRLVKFPGFRDLVSARCHLAGQIENISHTLRVGMGTLTRSVSEECSD